MQSHSLIGMIYIIFGLIIFFLALGGILLKIGFGLLGLWLVNKGMMMRGSGQIKHQVMNYMFTQRWF